MIKINKNYILIGIILIIVLFIAINIRNVMTANAIKEESLYEDWLKDSCDCVERERLKCPEGFELIGRSCIKEGGWTNALLGCSSYNCSGEIHEFDFDIEKWQKVN